MSDLEDNIMRTPKDSFIDHDEQFNEERQKILQSIIFPNKNAEYFEKLVDNMKESESIAKERYVQEILRLNTEVDNLKAAVPI